MNEEDDNKKRVQELLEKESVFGEIRKIRKNLQKNIKAEIEKRTKGLK